MARLTSAKARITEYLKSLGKDAAEIKEVFAELDAADADLDQAADAVSKNRQWNDWYQQIQPALSEIVSERDSLKQRIQKLEAAGLSFGEADAAARVSLGQQPAQTPGFNPEEFQSNIARATNTLLKDITRHSLKHFKDFNEELDLDAVEKLMGEKQVPFDVAYNLFTEPRREEKRQKEVTEKIKLGIQEGLQAELSKQGIRKTRKRTDDIDPAPLDKEAPSEHELKEAFLRDLDADITH